MTHSAIGSLGSFLNPTEFQAFIVLFFISFGLGIGIAIIHKNPSDQLSHKSQNFHKTKLTANSNKLR